MLRIFPVRFISFGFFVSTAKMPAAFYSLFFPKTTQIYCLDFWCQLGFLGFFLESNFLTPHHLFLFETRNNHCHVMQLLGQLQWFFFIGKLHYIYPINCKLTQRHKTQIQSPGQPSSTIKKYKNNISFCGFISVDFWISRT